MAIVNNGTVNSLPASQLPAAYTTPTVTTIADYTWKQRVELSVLKATVQNAAEETTMTNIIGNATIGITKQVTDLLANDYVATNTVTAYTVWVGLTSNQSSVGGDTPSLTDSATSYLCTVDIYTKIA
tara:strand:- start:475 stop:855 length:381 start_codon:yes stop_codon:yes gene_type:complete